MQNMTRGADRLTPDGFERYLKLGKIVDDILEDSPVLVTPTTLVKTKRPILLHRWKPSYAVLVRFHDILRCWSREEVQIDTTTKSSPRNIGRPQEDLLRMRVAEEDPVCVGIIFSSSICRVGYVR